ncbi:MAG: enoyl-CoA hydratase/isomerase family protein [Oscillochloris sp.]|nr:enoyl-CoA hydratase/isomerase family protein [Oscillochloris sp.]
MSETAGGVTTISLNRPQYYNALTRQLHQALLAALRQASRDPAVRAVILTGVGTAFCSGQDLREFPLDNPLSLADELRRNYHPVIMQMRNLGKPLIAAVNGPAARRDEPEPGLRYSARRRQCAFLDRICPSRTGARRRDDLLLTAVDRPRPRPASLPDRR